MSRPAGSAPTRSSGSPAVASRRLVKRRLRIVFWCALVFFVVGLKLADLLSRRGAVARSGVRLVTVNVDTRPAQVAAALRHLEPDVVFMQETAVPCADAGRVLGLAATDGSDQCLLSRWPVVSKAVAWPGPWQPPQVLVADVPGVGSLTLVNVRLALPHTVARLSGNAFYTAAQRRGQYDALREMVAKERRAVVCGDMNSFPFEMRLGPGFRDMWIRLTYGGTFPVWLPAARIDQCWASSDVTVSASWTAVVPSDHRAVVVDVRVGGGSD